VTSISNVGNAAAAVKTVSPPTTAAPTPLPTKLAADGDSPAKERAERQNGGFAPKSGVNKIA
jgi:hypothetical protein